jgi:rubrerythrin
MEPQHEQVVTRFGNRSNKADVLLPYETVPGRMTPEAQKIVERFHNIQQANQGFRTERQREKRRKEKVKQAAEEASEGDTIRYDGDVDKCVICLDRSTKNEHVTRLICRHVLHERCLTEYLVKSKKDDPPCPECRGTIRNPKGFKYIAEEHFVFSPAQSEGHRSDDDRHAPGQQANRFPRAQANPENPPDLGSSQSTALSQYKPNRIIFLVGKSGNFATMETLGCLMVDMVYLWTQEHGQTW